jgi:hypothetical protein
MNLTPPDEPQTPNQWLARIDAAGIVGLQARKVPRWLVDSLTRRGLIAVRPGPFGPTIRTTPAGERRLAEIAAKAKALNPSGIPDIRAVPPMH